MRKRIKCAIVIALLSSLFLTIRADAQFSQLDHTPAILRVNPAKVDVETGSDFEVNVTIDTQDSVFFFGIVLTYNTSVVDSLNISVLAPFELVNRIIADENGFILVEGAGGPVSGSVPLAHFVFHASDVGMSALTISDYYMDDSAHNSVSIDRVVNGIAVQWLLKSGFSDYAVSGMPDFDQRQNGWVNAETLGWSWCGPCAVADGLWWMDSKFEQHPLTPPVVSDGLGLVHGYGPWDDHDVSNVPPLIQDLAWCMDTDGNRTAVERRGTNIADMVGGLDSYFAAVGLSDKLSVSALKAPGFDVLWDGVKRDGATVLLLGFWQEQPAGSGLWVRVGGHYVAVAGVDPLNRRVALCDPYGDNAEMSGASGFVKPSSQHGHPVEPPDTVHNNATYVSYDSYNVTVDLAHVGESQIGVIYDPNYLLDVVNATQGQNVPGELVSFQGSFDPGLPVQTEVEYAVAVSCKTGLVTAGSLDGSVHVWDFYGSPQWTWNMSDPVVTVAMSNDGRFVAAESRSSSMPANGILALFDNAKGVPPGNLLWSVPLSISTSSCGNLSGYESSSVDVKNNTFNGFVVVTAASDNGVTLFDYLGNVIWNYPDVSCESVVRFSFDANYLVCCDLDSGVVRYFSDLRDGVAGWGVGDGMPIWSYGGAGLGLYAYWAALDGLGEYVVASMYPTPVWVDQSSSRVVLLDRTGSVVWTCGLPKGGFVKVEVSCDGKSVAAINSDPTDSVGCDLTLWSESTDTISGWGSEDVTPSWVFWPGKEQGQSHVFSDDFYALDVSEDGACVMAGGNSGNTYVLSSEGEVLANVSSVQNNVESVDVTFDGRYGVFGDSVGGVRLLDDVAGLRWSTVAGGRVSSVSVSKVYPSLTVGATCDAAVVNVTGCKDGCVPLPTVSQNYTCHFWVEVENQGDLPASVIVSLRANTSLIGVTVANVSAGEHRIVAFVWNTTGLARGNYTVTAFAGITRGEMDVGDNSYTDVFVVKLCGTGDVNGDGVVNLRDVGAISYSFSMTPGAEKWNPNADFNDDHVVDMRDMGIACNNYGKHYV